MKRLVIALFALAMLAVLPLTAFAATGINANEQAVLDKLDSSAVVGANGWSFSIPQEYINSAETYFAGDCEMTEAERDAIIGYIDAGMAIVKREADAQKFSGTMYDLADMAPEARDEILHLGQSACAEVDLQLTYAPSSNQVTITPVGSGTPVFQSAPVIKTTGEDFPLTAGLIGAIVVAVMAFGTVVMFAVSKKNQLV